MTPTSTPATDRTAMHRLPPHRTQAVIDRLNRRWAELMYEHGLEPQIPLTDLFDVPGEAA